MAKKTAEPKFNSKQEIREHFMQLLNKENLTSEDIKSLKADQQTALDALKETQRAEARG